MLMFSYATTKEEKQGKDFKMLKGAKMMEIVKKREVGAHTSHSMTL